MARRETPFTPNTEQLKRWGDCSRAMFDILRKESPDLHFFILSTLMLDCVTEIKPDLFDRLHFVSRLTKIIEDMLIARHREKASEEGAFITIQDHRESKIHSLVDSVDAKSARSLLISGLLRIIRKEDQTLPERMKAINHIKLLLETIIGDDYIVDGQ